jgi:S-adenosyl-L-methionine hydrolase (adenosine-forming)
MAQPILTLTTDFGSSDHYVGAMKGVILGICPQANIVDICHQVTPFAIAEGAFVIAQAFDCFPKKTVHVVVVDPGVGSARRPILVEAAGQFFIAPDNGILSIVCAKEKHKARLIANQRYFRQPVSATFHGRDIFAPVAAHLAAGASPSSIGKPIQDFVASDFANPRRIDDRRWRGHVLKIDHFGNIVTNFHVSDFPGSFADTRGSVTIGRRWISAWSRNYAEAGTSQLFLIVGSSGYLEISLNQGSAAGRIGCKSGSPANLILG